MLNMHSFQVEVALVIGVEKSILLEHLGYWVVKNKSNNKNFYDEKYWTYNSSAAFSKIFPYIKERTLHAHLSSLEVEGYIVSGNYNKNKMDRTKWYTLSDKGEKLLGLNLNNYCVPNIKQIYCDWNKETKNC